MSEHEPRVTANTLFAFSYQDFVGALEDWKAQQLAAYPHQAERIETTALAMQDLMHSSYVIEHKLVVRQTLARG